MLELRAFSEILFGPSTPEPGAVFVSAYDHKLTYAAFVECVDCAVCLLADSFEKRQTLVFVVADNTAGFVVALFALNHLAQIVVPVFAGYALEELRGLY